LRWRTRREKKKKKGKQTIFSCFDSFSLAIISPPFTTTETHTRSSTVHKNGDAEVREEKKEKKRKRRRTKENHDFLLQSQSSPSLGGNHLGIILES